MKELELIFEVDRKSILNANVSYHHFDKANRAKRLRTLAHEYTKGITRKFNHFNITAVICPPTRRRLDPPNLYPTVKHLIDGCTDGGMWDDDDWTHLDTMLFKYGGLSGIPKVFVVKLIIEEI